VSLFTTQLETTAAETGIDKFYIEIGEETQNRFKLPLIALWISSHLI